MKPTKHMPSPAVAGSPGGNVLDRLEYILLLTAVAIAVLVYPLCLDKDWMKPLMAGWTRNGAEPENFWRMQLEPFLSIYFSPLMLKGVLACVPMLAFVALRFIRWLLAPAARAEGGRWDWVSVPAFFGWVALSSLWGPTPGLAHAAALWALMFGAFFFCLLRRGLTLREMIGLAHLLLAMGAVAMLIAYLESIPFFGEAIFRFMYRFPDMRNRYGTLLGHNTAAASYFMMTAFPCLALLLIARERWRRLAYGVYLAMLLFAILVLQSRAVWIFFPILGVLAVRSGVRASLRRGAAAHASRLRWLPAILLGMLLLTLATQLVDRPWNPLYIRNNPFGQRLKALSIKGLQGESRVRMNVIGATLVPKAPLFGHGLFAFQMIYPRRQAEYFAEHPDTWLNQPTARSHMAHDEYLQVLIDQGAIGLGLLLWILAEVAVRGRWRRRELRGMARLLHEGLGWSALGFALHAFVDFPYHLPQLAVPGLLCLAAWGACRRRPQGDDPVVLNFGELASSTAFRPMVCARLLAVFTALLLVPLGTVPLIRSLQGDFFYFRASAYFQSYRNDVLRTWSERRGIAGDAQGLCEAIGRDPALTQPVRASLLTRVSQVQNVMQMPSQIEITPETVLKLVQMTQEVNAALAEARANPKMTRQAGENLLWALKGFNDFSYTQKVATLNQSIEDSEHAKRLSPYYELIPLEEAETYGALGTLLIDVAHHAADKAAAEKIAQSGRDILRKGIATLDKAQKGIDYHQVYWSRAVLYDQLAHVEPNGEAATLAYEHYRRDVRDALFFCPAASQFVERMLMILESEPKPDQERIFQLRKRFWKIDPALFTTDYINKVTGPVFDNQCYVQAAGAMDEFLKIDPNNVRWLNHGVVTSFWAGNRTRAAELTKKLYDTDPLSMLHDGAIVPVLCMQQKWSTLLDFLKSVNLSRPVEYAEFRALELELLRRLKLTGQAPIFNPPAGMSLGQWNMMVAEAVPCVLYHYFDEPARARQAMDERLAMAEMPPPGIRFWVEGCYIAAAQNDAAQFGKCLERVRQANPEAPVLKELARMLKPGPGK